GIACRARCHDDTPADMRADAEYLRRGGLAAVLLDDLLANGRPEIEAFELDECELVRAIFTGSGSPVESHFIAYARQLAFDRFEQQQAALQRAHVLGAAGCDGLQGRCIRLDTRAVAIAPQKIPDLSRCGGRGRTRRAGMRGIAFGLIRRYDLHRLCGHGAAVRMAHITYLE